MDKIEITFNKVKKTYFVISDPLPHILVQSHKLLHGWWQGKRECTAERLLINPYNGCSHNCFMCYAHSFNWGFFELYSKKKIITVCQNFDKIIAHQLNSLSIVSTGYLSSVTDPFQPINQKYGLSEKIIQEFISRNIPIEFITKNVIPTSVISMIKKQKHSFGQVSILTLKEDLHKLLCPGATTIKNLLNNLKMLADENIHAVCRIDPVIPYITDNKNDLKELIQVVVDSGAKHIIASCLDIPLSIEKNIMKFLSIFGWEIVYDYGKLYHEVIDLVLHAQLDYRRKIFSFLREECDKKNITFALCMEFKIRDKKPIGLNKEFMSSVNCEGIDIPIYVREGNKFKPIAFCNGACLVCKKPICGINELFLGKTKDKEKGWKLSDYRRWSKNFMQPQLEVIK